MQIADNRFHDCDHNLYVIGFADIEQVFERLARRNAGLAPGESREGVAFVGLFLVASLCFFPVALLTLGAGYVYISLYGLGFGILVSFVVCYIGYLIGAAVCFARSRYLMRRLIVRFSARYPIVRAVDRAFESQGFRLFVLLRVSPAMPFNALNYIGGITSIKFRSYWWATCVGVVPDILWTIFVGAAFGTVDAKGVDGNQAFNQNGTRRGLLLGLGIGLGVAALIGTGIYARRELIKIAMSEQHERTLEEQAAENISERLMNSFGVIHEGDEDERSLSFEDLENPQLCGNQPEYTEEKNEIAQNDNHSCNPSPMRDQGPAPDTPLDDNQYQRRHVWTPESLSAELPVIPRMAKKLLQGFRPPDSDPVLTPSTPRRHVDSEDSGTSSVEENESMGNMKRRRSSSFPTLPVRSLSSPSSHHFEPNQEDTTYDDGIQRRHSVEGSPYEIHVLSRAHRERPSSPHSLEFEAASGDISILANIDETSALDLSVLSTTMQQDSMSPSRERCLTDPLDAVHLSVAAKDPTITCTNEIPTADRRSPGLRKRHSFSSLKHVYKTAASSLPRAISSHEDRARTPSESLDNQIASTRHHPSEAEDSEDDDPSREWFWIWA
ncbi:hypothetical protein THAOC_20443 [Thalassiosira oceanica]|uniref:VTT domain-containing protein n=1 Tax=Thalassiosira oceanica TaxID=159749 RepID=K0S290_THAOC|nr:hypothetical protein THAOC_20443 [Thalassiosira oceanica]|eukprot:EJK59350.1 hypothetical protein THAOC_20443 [Thalassiosira oceanica]